MSDATRPPGGAIRVGEFVLDPRSGELCGESGRHTLSAQPLHVLLALIERPGGIVTRDELRARLWPADTFVDFEHGLNAIVKRLRDALGDSADTPRYIETVPRRGYRLVAAVVRPEEQAPAPAPAPIRQTAPPVAEPSTSTAVADAEVSPSSPAAAGVAPSRRRRIRMLVVAAALGMLGIGGLASFLHWRTAEAAYGDPAPPPDVQPTRITFGPGLQTGATWSPDGRRIAFVWDRDGNFDLFTQSVDGGEPNRITSSPANETQPAWSPDGQRLVFRSEEDGGGLFTVLVGGGAVRRIASHGFRPAWMPDGRDIVFASAGMHLYLVAADGGGPPRQILKRQIGGVSSFAVLADGRLSIYGVHPTFGLGFFVSDRAYTSLRPLAMESPLPPEWVPSGTRAHWSPAGDAVFIEAVSAGVPGIWRAAVDPTTLALGRPVRFTTGLAAADAPAISPDGTRLAFTSAQSAKRVWVFPFDASRGTSPGDGRVVTDEEASVRGLNISADGAAIYYVEERPGRSAARGMRTDLATGETSLLVGDVGNSGVVPSTGGHGTSYQLVRRIAGLPRGGFEFALVWRDQAGHERLLSRWGAAAFVPTDWRRDDRAVLGTFMKRAYTGAAALAEWSVGPTAETSPSRVLLESSSKAFWQGHYSPDGRWVSFVALDVQEGSQLELGIAPATSTSAATWTRIAADHPWPDKPRWSPDGRTLYFLSLVSSGFFNVWGVRMDPERGVSVDAPFQVTHFDSPRWHVDPNAATCEMGVAKGVLALPMRTVKGSIWLMSNAGT